MRTREEIQNKVWLSEPRKHKVRSNHVRYLRYFFKKYKELYWEDKSNRISSSLFSKLIKDIHNEIAKAISEEAFEYQMPLDTGLLFVGLKKPWPLRMKENGVLNRPINTKATLELWARDEKAFEKKTKVYFTNLHSNGLLPKIQYTTWKYAYFKGKRCLSFIPMRSLKKRVSYVIQHKSEFPDANFYEIDYGDNTKN